MINFYCLTTSDFEDQSAFDILKKRLNNKRYPLYKKTPFLDKIKKNDNVLFYVAGKNHKAQNFIGTAISDELRYQDYLITRDEEVIKPWTNRPLPLEDFKLNNNQAGLSNWLSPYGIGQVATEFIVASTGLDSLLNIFKYTNELNDFSLGFTKATSIELTQFYKLFDQGRVLWGIQAVS
jgi:hypothetical protein